MLLIVTVAALCRTQAWDLFVIGLVCYFIYSTVVQLSVAKQLELDEEAVEKRKGKAD